MIKTDNLIFEYEKRDEEGNVIGTHCAIDEVNLDIELAVYCDFRT